MLHWMKTRTFELNILYHHKNEKKKIKQKYLNLFKSNLLFYTTNVLANRARKKLHLNDKLWWIWSPGEAVTYTIIRKN